MVTSEESTKAEESIRAVGVSEQNTRKFHQDELSRLDDIEALMTTARDLAARFRGFEMSQTAASIQSAISYVRIARSQIIDRTRG